MIQVEEVWDIGGYGPGKTIVLKKEYIGHFMTNDFTVVPFSEDTG